MKNFTCPYFYRTNATAEENKQALLDDSVAFALGCTAVSVIQFIFGAISIDLLNFSSLRQVSYIGINHLFWNSFSLNLILSIR